MESLVIGAVVHGCGACARVRARVPMSPHLRQRSPCSCSIAAFPPLLLPRYYITRMLVCQARDVCESHAYCRRLDLTRDIARATSNNPQ
eukprot:7891625-Pyramimonas_sp.AAC.1